MAWFELLIPASFNGVPFYIEQTQRQSGRNLAVHDYPLRDDPFLEDLGRLPRKFTITAYVGGDTFALQRALLESVLENSSTAGTLIHPTYGILTVWIGGTIKSAERRTDGSYSTVEFECYLDGGAASPLSITDTASALLAGFADLTPFLEDAYVAAVGLSVLEAVVAAVAGTALSAANLQFLALPQSTQAGIAPGFAANVTNAQATAAAVTAAFAAAAANVVAAQALPAASGSAVAGSVGALVPLADPSGGLAALAAFGAGLPVLPAVALPSVTAAQAAVVTLVQGAALAALMLVYAQTDWQSANQAQAAQAQVRHLVDAQVEAAADSGNFDLFRAWRAMGAIAQKDFAQRARNLPSLAAYNVPAPMPALVLSQYLYQSSANADELVALNQAPHPIFMPAAGVWLEAA